MVRADIVVNKIIGMGSSKPAKMDENAENIFVKKLQIPRDVAQNRVGNIGA